MKLIASISAHQKANLFALPRFLHFIVAPLSFMPHRMVRGEIMFDNNWMIYIFIIVLLFSGGGGIMGTELAVLIATIGAVLLSEGGYLGNFFGCACNQTTT